MLAFFHESIRSPTCDARALFWGMAVLFFCGLQGVAEAGQQSVTLAWDASRDNNIAGYAVYYGTNSGSYWGFVDAGTNSSASIPGLKEGLTYYIIVTAYDAKGDESAPSNEITYVVPGALVLARGPAPTYPLMLQFPVAPGHWYELQATVDFKTWSEIWRTAIASSNGWVTFRDPQVAGFKRRFYRLVLH